jgi:hypothetical protein
VPRDLVFFFSVSSEGPPHSVASHDTHGDAEDLSNPDPHGAITQVKFKFGHGLYRSNGFLQGLFLLEKCFVTTLWLLFGCLYRVRIACLDAS